MLTLGCWNVARIAWSERLVVHVMVLCLVIEILFSPVTCTVSLQCEMYGVTLLQCEMYGVMCVVSLGQ